MKEDGNKTQIWIAKDALKELERTADYIVDNEKRASGEFD